MPVSRTRARSGTEVISRIIAPIEGRMDRNRTGTIQAHEVALAMRRIGVMGGTFDPIHHGHLVAASEVAHIFDLDEVIFVPTGQPYQKGTRKVSAAEDRYLMTVVATASNPRVSVSRADIDRPGPPPPSTPRLSVGRIDTDRPAPTYTIDTLREIRVKNDPDDELYFITG